MLIKKVFLLFFLLLSLSILYTPARANVTIGPNQISIMTNPGREKSETVEIKNHSDQLYKIRVELSDALQEAGGMKFVPPGETSYSCSAWTTVTPQEIRLEGQETKNVTITIRPEPDAKGSFHGAVIFIIMPVVESNSQFQVIGQVGAVVLTSVFIKGTLKPKVDIHDTSYIRVPPIRSVSMDMAPQPTAVLNLENTGNCMINLQGELVIRHPDTNRRIASGSILSINYATPPTIPPGTTRPLLIPLNRFLPNGEYIAATKFTYGPRNRLNTNVTLVVGDGTPDDTGDDTKDKIQLGFLPQMLDMRLRPGAKRSSSVSIINFEKDEVRLTAEIFPLSLTSDGLPQIGAQQPGALPINEYFEVKFISDKLASGQKGRIILMVKMPKEVDMPGLGVLRLKTETMDGDKTRESYLYYPLLVSLDGTKSASLDIDSIDYLPAFNEQSPDRVVLTVHNNGNNYCLIKGMVEVREEAGYVYGSQFYGNEASMLILPGGKREVEVLLKPKEHLKSGTNYVLNLKTDIYEESMVRQRRIIKILNKKSQTVAFTLDKDEAGKLMVAIIENKDQEDNEEQVASGPKD